MSTNQMSVPQTAAATEGEPRFSLGKREERILTLIVSYTLLTVVVAAMLLPFFWMLSTSLKTPAGIRSMPPKWIPEPLTFDNYEQVIEKTNVVRGFRNSTWVALTTTIAEVFVGTLAGFGFARMRFPGRAAFFGLLLATMMIPPVVTMVPSFILFKQLGWLPGFKPLIIPVMFGTPFAIFLSRQFFMSLPGELIDAAKVDGCNYFQIYLYIFLPLAKPLIATLFVLGFIARWNDYLGPLIYLQGAAEKATIPLELSRLTSINEPNWTLAMAGSAIALFPIVTLFFIFQRYFVESIAMTGLKG